MITKKQYVEYLLSTPESFTCTHMADHLEGVSHDVVNDFLQHKRLMPRQLSCGRWSRAESTTGQRRS